ncbi:HEPN domain-containing protein [Palleniella muris]|uniref:HEPN domain-containing protein n=1 Tax=Palleniella muris TaxID=3038145 RepID=A0AC61QMG9_9BACT|nr:HEPN domain-containing protein [Palleniella muris]TGX80497.1 HEPN domain-containing protein [Palleniella muris]
MKSKALENLSSAQILINNKQFTTSVHCSYYAVFQYMKYALSKSTFRPIDYFTQDSHNGESSHEYILTEVKNRIQTNPRNLRSFTEGVRNLKQNRVDADYHLRNFSDIEGIECRDNAEKLIKNLNNYFDNL